MSKRDLTVKQIMEVNLGIDLVKAKDFPVSFGYKLFKMQGILKPYVEAFREQTKKIVDKYKELNDAGVEVIQPGVKMEKYQKEVKALEEPIEKGLELDLITQENITMLLSKEHLEIPANFFILTDAVTETDEESNDPEKIAEKPEMKSSRKKKTS